MLKAQDEVVSEADDDHVAARLLPPSLDPEVEHVVKVDVGQERADAPALNRTHLALRSLPVLQHARVEPFLDQPHHSPVRNTMLDEAHCEAARRARGVRTPQVRRRASSIE